MILFASISVFADTHSPVILLPNIKITSSELFTEKNKYPLYNLIDKNSNTTWVFKTSNINQSNIFINIEVIDDDLIKYIRLINGFSKSENLYFANNRIIQIGLTIDNNNKSIIDLKETLDFQDIELNKSTKSLIMSILKVNKGRKYLDICISELELLDSNKNNILDKYNYFIFNESGEYSDIYIYDKKINKYFHSNKEGITGYGFSPNGDKIFLNYSEIDGVGFDVYYLKTKEIKSYLTNNKYVETMDWISNNYIKIKWYDLRDIKGITNILIN